MMKGWKIVKLADYYKVSSGLSKSADQFGSGQPFVSFKDVFWNYFLPENLIELVNTNEKEQEKCSVNKGDVFLTRTSEKIEELGMSCVALKDYPYATFNGFTKRLRPITNKIDPQFIGFYLRSPQFRAEITAYSTLTTRASLNNDIIGRLRVNLPPLPTQRKIASILSAYDDLIENNLKRIKLLEEKAQLTYEEWFVRMKFPGHENVAINEETGLPEGWEILAFGEFVKTSSGGTPSRKKEVEYYKEGNIPWVRTGELKNFMILDSEFKITEKGLKNSSAKLFPKNTVLLAMYGNTIGETSFVRKAVSSNQACCAFLVKEKQYLSFFIHQYLRYNKKYVLNFRMGAAQENISQSIIQNIKVKLPIEGLLIEFGAEMELVYQQIENLLSQNQLLKEARDILLPRLMTGMINPSEIEGGAVNEVNESSPLQMVAEDKVMYKKK